jgi:diguanylate cyclase (GGDEF)-like protein
MDHDGRKGRQTVRRLNSAAGEPPLLSITHEHGLPSGRFVARLAPRILPPGAHSAGCRARIVGFPAMRSCPGGAHPPVKPPSRTSMPRRPSLCWLALVLMGLAWSTCATAALPIEVDRLDANLPASAIEELRAGRHDAGFRPQAYAALEPSPDAAVWYRIRPVGTWTSPYSPVLRVFDPQGLRIEAWLPPAYEATSSSIYQPLADPGFTRHALVFRLPLDLAAGTPIYFRVAPERAIPRALDLVPVTQARAEDLARAQLDIVFPAVQLATVLVMLSFFFALRERMYIWFAAHVLFIVVYELYAFGVGYGLPPFRWLAPLGARPLWFCGALSAAFLSQFTRRFLELGSLAPRLDRLLVLALWPLAAVAVCAVIPPLSVGWWLEKVLAVTFGALVPLLVLAGLVAWQRGGRRGGFYLCAWTPGLMLVLVRVLQLLLHWPLPEWLVFTLPATFAFASLVLAFGLADSTLSIRHERDVANRLAERDALTGALNRRAILAHFNAAFQRAREGGRSLSVLFLDLDHFKQINDRHGHAAGDRCLGALIAPIMSELRQGDALGRYGGEEFLIVLPGATAANAEVVAERIRARIEALPVLVSGIRIGLTLSIGIAGLDDSVATPRELIERADMALYRAKSSGRNCIRTHPEETRGEAVPQA